MKILETQICFGFNISLTLVHIITLIYQTTRKFGSGDWLIPTNGDMLIQTNGEWLLPTNCNWSIPTNVNWLIPTKGDWLITNQR